MSFNGSTSLNASLNLPSESSLTVLGELRICMNSRVGLLSILFLTASNSLILLPVCLYVLHLGAQRWRQWSHCDAFTYHISVFELMNVMGCALCCVGVYASNAVVQTVGIYLFSFVFSGQMMFHLLTCTERYLAVIHPITYMGLRRAKGIRARNVVIGCVWLTSLLGMGSMSLEVQQTLANITFFSFPFILVFIAFCSISVLCALIRPAPGAGEGNRWQDPNKKMAFWTIMAILGVLLLRFGGHICLESVFKVVDMNLESKCATWLTEFWFCLPSSLVLPLLFLHRARKLSCPNCRCASR